MKIVPTVTIVAIAPNRNISAEATKESIPQMQISKNMIAAFENIFASLVLNGWSPGVKGGAGFTCGVDGWFSCMLKFPSYYNLFITVIILK